MAVAQYQPIGRLIPVIIISLFYGAVTFLSLLWNVIKLGPRRFFAQKNRTKRPEVLDDPQYGTHHFARLRNIRLHYVAKGPEDKPLVLFLHGFPEFWYSWRHQLKEFGEDYRCVAVDMRGYGESEKPEGIAQYHTSKLTDDIKDLIEYLGYKKCTIVAHDWGGALGWMFAAKYPEYVEKYIVCNMPNPFAFQKHLQSSWKQFRMSWYMFMFQNPILPEIFLRSRDVAFMEGIMKPVMNKNPEAVTIDDMEAFKYTFKNYNDINGPLNYYRSSMRYQPEVLPNSKVQAPVMIIFGTGDTALDKGCVEASRKYVESECTVHYIEGASHWVQQEAPNEVNAFMREFLPK